MRHGLANERTNALWGKGNRGRTMVAVVVLALALPLGATADPGKGNGKGAGQGRAAFVPSKLSAAAQASPQATFRVIVQGAGGSDSVASALDAERSKHPGKAKGMSRRFDAIDGVAAEVTGEQLAALATRDDVLAVTPDAPTSAAAERYLLPYSNQSWPYKADLKALWGRNNAPPPQPPAIAIVDSGVDTTRPDLAGRVVAEVSLTSAGQNSPGDGRGHGTFVAAVAAGSVPGYAGAAPTANIVSLDVLNDRGMGYTSDVIAACDWILRNKGAYNIRVANFSLHSSGASSFTVDPLDKAVEKLWLSGVVVVAASGNYGTGGQAGRVRFAPANDPFVITVGALDSDTNLAAPWSVFGYTYDGFRKPELGAPGRYMTASVPQTSTMTLERPDRMVAPNYMRMSGTSFAAPVVAGAAAALLGYHLGWTPDQVKGALMQTADPLAYGATPYSLGAGRLHGSNAVALTNPTNPNRALEQFLVPDPAGGTTPVFDAVSWTDAARADVSWDDVSWDDVSWDDVSWDDVSWDDVSWDDVSWDDVSWTDVSWTDVSWTDVSWADLTWVR